MQSLQSAGCWEEKIWRDLEEVRRQAATIEVPTPSIDTESGDIKQTNNQF